MWGHRWGFDMTATTAIPEAVRTGLARSFGSSESRSESGTAAIISTSLGARERPYFRHAADLSALRSTFSPLRDRSTMEFTISAMARTRASSSDSPWASKPPRPGFGTFLGSATIAVAIGREKRKRERVIRTICLKTMTFWLSNEAIYDLFKFLLKHLAFVKKKKKNKKYNLYSSNLEYFLFSKNKKIKGIFWTFF